MSPPASKLDLRLVPSALAAWAVTAAGIAWGLGPLLAALGAAVGAIWWLAGRVPRRRSPVLLAASSGIAAAAVVAAGFGIAVGLRNGAVAHHPLTQHFGTTVWVTLAPTESPRQAGPGRLMFRADLARVGEAEISGTVTVFAPAVDAGQLTVGQPARLRARVTKPARRDLTVATLIAVGRPQLGRAPALQRIAQAVRGRFAAAARENLPADQAALLPGLVLGDTTAIPAGAAAEFRTAGLAHLTAVSGANVTIVCGAVLLSAHVIGPRAAVVLSAAVLAVFVVVVEPTASVLRAAVMGAIGLLAVLSGRRRQAIPALAATVIALLLVAPQLAVDLGFALSVSATAALIVLAPVWSARLVARGWPKPLADACCVALAAQLVTAPLVAAISGRFSAVSMVANLAVGLVIPPITVLGTAAAALVAVWPAATGLLIRFTGPQLWWLLRVSHAAAGLPGAAVPVPSGWGGVVGVGAATGAAIVLWRWRWFRRVAAGGLLCAVAWSVSGLFGGP